MRAFLHTGTRGGKSAKGFFPQQQSPSLWTLVIVCTTWASPLLRGAEKEPPPVMTLSTFTESVDGMAFSLDGTLLVTAGGGGRYNIFRPGGLIFWDVAKGNSVTRLDNDLPTWTFQMSSDGKLAATGSVRGQVKLWDMQKKELLGNLHGHKSQIASVSFSRDAKLLATISRSESPLEPGAWERTVLKIWDVSALKEKVSFDIPRKTKDIGYVTASLSPDGKWVAVYSGDNTPIRFLDTATGKELNLQWGGFLFSPDGKTVIGARSIPEISIEQYSADAGFPGLSIVGWELSGGKETFVLKCPNHTTEAICLSADGKWLAAGGPGGAAKVGGHKGLGASATVWNLATGKEQAHVLVHKFLPGCRSVALSPDGKILATTAGAYQASDYSVKLWDTQTGKEITPGARPEPPVEDPGVRAAAAEKAAAAAIAKRSGKIERPITSVSFSSLSDQELKELLPHLAGLKELRTLTFAETKITDAAVKDLAGLKQVHTLNLRGTKLTSAGIKELAGFQQLRGLNLDGIKLTTADLRELAKLKELQSLDLVFTYVTDEGCKELAAMKQLRHLDLTACQVTEDGVEELAGLEQLRFLSLQANGIGDRALKELVGLKHLQNLDLGGNRITDQGLKVVAGMSQLRQLILQGNGITDAGLMELAPLKQLQWLYVMDTRVTPQGVERLRKLLPGCSIVLSLQGQGAVQRK